MANHPAQALKEYKKENDHLICIDSDGCAFDAMEIKHKECFVPTFIRVFNLQPVAKYARETWEFVNLYSNTRGCNRFQAIIRTLDLLAERPEVIARGYKAPDITTLRNWVTSETRLGNPALESAVKSSGDPILSQTLVYSLEANEAVTKMIHDVPPFPSVRAVLEKAAGLADLIVVSATPAEALFREWNEHSLSKYVKAIAGQEMGTKKEHIAFAKGGRYEDSKVLKLGDALGDLAAAKENGVNFFPINPGYEEQSWKLFLEEGLERFIRGEYTGEYEDHLINEFKRLLPETPLWKRTGQLLGDSASHFA